MAVALPAVIAAAAVVSAVGVMNDANARKDAAHKQQEFENRNAAFAHEQGELEVVQQARRNYLRTSSARAGYAASGIREGSSLDVLEMAASQAELDTQNIRRVAGAKAQGYMDSSVLDGMRANSAMTGGYYAAAGSLLSGGAKAYSYTSGTGTPLPADSSSNSQSQQIS